jgi:hypothetical protein
MATMSASRADLFSRTAAVDRTTRVPWYIWCAALAGTSLMVGVHWDISWHESIGRDTFWTPAHMAIYMCGVLAGVAFGYLILHTTLSRNSPLRAASVNIWGFRAPLGAFVASWGGIAMLTSAPFDDWWHGAYGLDVKIVSPPHILLFSGGYGVLLGTILLITGRMNREPEAHRPVYRRLFLYMCGIALVMGIVLLMEYTDRVFLHTARPYILICALTPIMLTIGSRVSGIRFAATYIAGFYTLFLIGLILVLPLFPAEPKLGPVYQNVTHFIPPEFPILIIVPAFLLDLLWQRVPAWKPWTVAVVSGAIYVSALVAVEWPFASFLMSPAARNRFFGTGYLFYSLPPNSFLALNHFVPSRGAEAMAIGLLLAFLFATLGVRWGISRSNWMKAIQR